MFTTEGPWPAPPSASSSGTDTSRRTFKSATAAGKNDQGTAAGKGQQGTQERGPSELQPFGVVLHVELPAELLVPFSVWLPVGVAPDFSAENCGDVKHSFSFSV